MRGKIKRVVCFLSVMLVLAANLPLTARAVDPVSAATIANAFAQAITAYGASNGVSMTFDGVTSGNTSDIGETVHELWKTFRSGQQTADDYETIAAAIFPGLYSKAITAGGSAVVAVNIAQQYMPDIDDFWNWLLSGPAEMVKVDNAYQWPVNSNTGTIDPISVYNVTENTFGGIILDTGTNIKPMDKCSNVVFSGNDTIYGCYVEAYSSYISYYYSTSPFTVSYVNGYNNNQITLNTTTYQASNGDTYYRASPGGGYRSTSGYPSSSIIYSSVPVPTSIVVNVESNESTVRPYVGDAVARPVPIPDTSDPDYGPLPYIGNLPIPWNDTLFGDGTGSLTDSQSDAISKAVDDAIVANPDKTLETEREATDDPDRPTTDDPPSNDPDDYTVPGLQTIFPFCIPFDVYNFLSALAADPVPPHFTATLQFPAAIGGAQTIDIDFNTPTFNQIASILRTLELLAFIVGLALLTRSMFIRG